MCLWPPSSQPSLQPLSCPAHVTQPIHRARSQALGIWGGCTCQRQLSCCTALVMSRPPCPRLRYASFILSRCLSAPRTRSGQGPVAPHSGHVGTTTITTVSPPLLPRGHPTHANAPLSGPGSAHHASATVRILIPLATLADDRTGLGRLLRPPRVRSSVHLSAVPVKQGSPRVPTLCPPYLERMNAALGQVNSQPLSSNPAKCLVGRRAL